MQWFREIPITKRLHWEIGKYGNRKVFPEVPIIGFKINKNVKEHFVRSQ